MWKYIYEYRLIWFRWSGFMKCYCWKKLAYFICNSLISCFTLRECVEKIQLLKTPEERQRRLREIPEVHSDPKMDPDYESEENAGESSEDKKQGLLLLYLYGYMEVQFRSHVFCICSLYQICILSGSWWNFADEYLRPRYSGFRGKGNKSISPPKIGEISSDTGGRLWSKAHLLAALDRKTTFLKKYFLVDSKFFSFQKLYFIPRFQRFQQNRLWINLGNPEWIIKKA